MEADLNSIWFWRTLIRRSPRSRLCCTVITVPQMTTRTTLTVPPQQLFTDSLTGGDKTHLCPLLLLHSHISFGKHTCTLTLMTFPAWIQLLEAPCGNEAVRFPSLATQSYGHSVGQVCACWFLRETIVCGAHSAKLKKLLPKKGQKNYFQKKTTSKLVPWCCSVCGASCRCSWEDCVVYHHY